MKQMPAGQFKSQCLAIMDQAQRSGEPVLITKRGKPVAKLVPVANKGDDIFGFLEGNGRIIGDLWIRLQSKTGTENDLPGYTHPRLVGAPVTNFCPLLDSTTKAAKLSVLFAAKVASESRRRELLSGTPGPQFV